MAGKRPSLGVCSVCGKKSWSAHSSKCEEHRPKAQQAAEPRTEQSTAAKIVGALPAIDKQTFSGKPPTADEWQSKLGALVVLATMTYVEYGAIRPSGLPEPYATQMTNQLAMTDAEAESIVEPFAHLFAGLEANKKYGRQAIEFLAFAPAMLSALEWYSRVAAFKRETREHQETGTPRVIPPDPTRGETNGSGRRAEAAPPAEGGVAPPGAVINFGGPGVWDPDQAPTARVHPNGTDLDDPDRALEAADLAINGAAGAQNGGG